MMKKTKSLGHGLRLTLLAGAWSLLTSEAATREDAEQMIDGFDRSEHLDTEGPGDNDAQKDHQHALRATGKH